MNINESELKTLRSPLETALEVYESLLDGAKFQDFSNFLLTPEKPNSARTVVPVTYNGTKLGDLYAIVFAKTDGTGDSKTYSLKDLTVPKSYRHEEKSDRILPRSKQGVYCEGCFPLFSINNTDDISMFAASLEEIGLDQTGKRIKPLWTLGVDAKTFSEALSGKVSLIPKIYYTVGFFEDKRFGDPHSIYFDKKTADAIQVVGFFGISENIDVPDLTSGWIYPEALRNK